MHPDLRSGIECAPQRTTEEGIIVSRASRTAASLALASLIVGVAASLILLYRTFQRQSATPAPLRDAGSVQLFFDRPAIPATLDARIEERPGGSASISYGISLGQEYSGPRVRFFLTMSGMAKAPETYPNGEPNVEANGCWGATYVVTDEKSATRCYREKLSKGFGYAPPEYRIETQVITGVLSGKNPRARWVTALVYPDRGFAVSAGKRTYFTLPGIGTPYLPIEYREKIKTDLGRGYSGFVPSRLDLLVNYGQLAPTERLDSVAPEPERAGMKSWIELDASTISARGSLVDVAFEDQAQRDTFLYGAYVGVAATVLPILIEKLWALRRRKEPSTEDLTRPQLDRANERLSEVPMPGTELLRRQLRRHGVRASASFPRRHPPEEP